MLCKLMFLNPVVSKRKSGSIPDGRVDLCISASLEDTPLPDFRRLDVEVGSLLEAERLLAAIMFNNG